MSDKSISHVVKEAILNSRIRDNLITDDGTLVLSAKQGLVLKGILDTLQGDLDTLASNAIMADGSRDMDTGYTPINPLSVINKGHFDLNQNLHRHVSLEPIPSPFNFSTLTFSPLTDSAYTTMYFSGDSHPNNTQTYMIYNSGSRYVPLQYISSINKDTGVWDEETIADLPIDNMQTEYGNADIFQTNDGSLYCASVRALGGTPVKQLVFHKYNGVSWDVYWITDEGWDSTYILYNGDYDWKYEETTGKQVYCGIGFWKSGGFFKFFDLSTKTTILYSQQSTTLVRDIKLYDGNVYFTTISSGLGYIYASRYADNTTIYGATEFAPTITTFGYTSFVMKNGSLYVAIGLTTGDFTMVIVNPLTGLATSLDMASGSGDLLRNIYLSTDGKITTMNDDGYIATKVFTGTGEKYPIRYQLFDRINAQDVEGDKSVNLCFDEGGDASGALSENSFVAGASNITSQNVRGSASIGRYSLQVDALLTIGNGNDSASRSNAIEVYEDGNVVAPNLSTGLITNVRSFITKEYFETSPQALHATDALRLTTNILYLYKGDGTSESVDLSLYLDDTNLAQIISGTYVVDEPQVGDKSLKFTRDDASVFYIDASMFFDDTNLVLSVDSQTGAVDLTSVYARLSVANLFTAGQTMEVSAGANALDFTATNSIRFTATSANITVGTMALKKGKEFSVTIDSAENVTGWGAEFLFAPDFSAVTPTPPATMTGTMEFYMKVVEVNGVDGGTANKIHVAWAQ